MSECRGIALHKHSTTDWDFGTVNWELSATHFVTPPTSLHGKPGNLQWLLCRVPESLVLPQGRLVFWLYTPDKWGPEVMFRHQSALGDASGKPRYQVRFMEHQYIDLYVLYPGGSYEVGHWGKTLTLGQWQRWRLTWWDGYDMMNNPATAIELECLEAGDWVSYGILYDTGQYFKDSDKNRVGFNLIYALNWIDDVQIWVPL